MEALVFLDTHAGVWLASGKLELLSPNAKAVIESAEQLLVSPMVHLELQYLREIGRVGVEASEILLTLATKLGAQLADHSFRAIVESSQRLTWTRDPFDRLIVGHAMAAGGTLVTRDETILANYSRAIW